MKNRLNLILLISFLIPILVFGQKNAKSDENAIQWTKERALVWDDFQKKAPKRHEASAMSDITFAIEVKTVGEKLEIHVEPAFNPSGSWVKNDDKTVDLLKHEQVHFDIYEVNARKMRKEFHEKKFTTVNAQNTMNRLIEKYTKLNQSVQAKYDLETEHSIKADKQAKWNREIADDLVRYQEYSEPRFEVEIEFK